jgi:ribonuclease HII
VVATIVFEDRLRSVGFARVAGCDEAGRGALAGPLVAAAVVLPRACGIQGLTDSKLLTPLRRERFAEQIRQEAVSISVVWATPATIDRAGIHRTNLELLARALRSLPGGFDYGLSDGYAPARTPEPVLGMPKGDQVAACIAAASIIAKVTRDRMLVQAARRFPGYGFERNKGYGTREHWDALHALGPSPYHRRSFTGVAAAGRQGLLPGLDPVLGGSAEHECAVGEGSPPTPRAPGPEGPFQALDQQGAEASKAAGDHSDVGR